MNINQAMRVPAAMAGTDRPKSIGQAAEAFESMFLGQLLTMAREGGGQNGLGEADGTSATIMEMAEERLAAAITKGGGLGLARVIVQQVSNQAAGKTVSEDPA